MVKRNLTKAKILHLATLSKLILTESEVEKLGRQLGETLDYMENLGEVKMGEVEDMPAGRQELGEVGVLREDEIEKERQLLIEKALCNSKKRKGNYFVVKKIL